MASGASEPERLRRRREVRRREVRASRRPLARPDLPERDILSETPGSDGKEKRAWLTAQRAALELHEKMGTVVSRGFVVARLAEVGRIVSEALEKVPARIAHTLAAESDPARVREVLSREIRQALSGLASALEERPVEALDVEAATLDGPGRKRRKRLRSELQ